MEFIILKNNLQKGLAIIARALAAKSPMEVINNVYIKSSKGGIELTGTNLHFTISCWLGASVKMEGELLVPAKIFIDLINEIHDEKITLTLKGQELTVKSDTVKTKINTVLPDDYPKIDRYIPDQSFKITTTELNKVVSKTLFSVASDNSRVVLTGLNFNVSDNILKIVGLDGFRLAEYTLEEGIKNTEGTSDSYQFIVPAMELQSAIKSFSQYGVEEITIEVNLSKNYLQLNSDDIFAQIVLISGDYPNYQSIIPTEFNHKIIIDKEKFGNGIKLINIFAKELGNAVKMIINNDILILESQPNSLGQNNYELKIDTPVNENIEIVFNAKYLLDFINNTDGSEVILELIEGLKPGKFTDPDTPNYWYIVMPMQSSW